jgi:hypothetical protein
VWHENNDMHLLMYEGKVRTHPTPAACRPHRLLALRADSPCHSPMPQPQLTHRHCLLLLLGSPSPHAVPARPARPAPHAQDEATGKQRSVRVTHFPVATKLVNELMTVVLQEVPKDPLLRHKLFQASQRGEGAAWHVWGGELRWPLRAPSVSLLPPPPLPLPLQSQGALVAEGGRGGGSYRLAFADPWAAAGRREPRCRAP